MRLGIQIIGLTFNSINEENYILQSLFLENGGSQCGYISKPNWMCLRNPRTLYSKNFENPLFMLIVRAISAQNCIVNEYQGSYYL
jgi:aerobic-type carbon monoxide dehydrogenase small subunit (CoxS/CutS family)